MSYDVSLHPQAEFSAALELGNMTDNVAPMWRLASPTTDGLAGIDGKKGSEVADQLAAAVNEMKNHPDKYLALEPSNKWGSYLGALKYLGNIADAARQHPEATFKVDR